jgi:hypothetical protein
MSGLTFLDETSLRQLSPEQLLHHMLSTKSYLSATSSLAATSQEAYHHPDLRPFVKVGQGQCGAVWALTGTTKVLKIMHDGKAEQLLNDFRKHALLLESFQQTPSKFRRNISLPDLITWVGPRNEMWWKEHTRLFPAGMQPTHGIVSSRIFPVPLPVRSAIVDAFAQKAVKVDKERFLSQPDNKDCLIRMYLGRRQQRSMTNTFRLRNFDMTVNEMEFLRLDTEMYAETMAQTLAIIHWKAKLDGNDVEFVFGSAPKAKMRPLAAELEQASMDDVEKLSSELDFKHRAIGIWILDFDQCQRFTDDANGVKQLERGFYFNDPYYPRPSSDNPKDEALWQIFKDSYLTTSAALTSSPMPKQFIEAVEAEGRKRSAGGSLFA